MALILSFPQAEPPIRSSSKMPADFSSPSLVKPDAHKKLALLERHNPDAAGMVERVINDCLDDTLLD